MKWHFFPIYLVVKKVTPAENALEDTLFCKGEKPCKCCNFNFVPFKIFYKGGCNKMYSNGGRAKKNISAHSDSLNVRHAYFLKTYECKYQRYVRISWRIMCIAVIWGIMRKMRQCLQSSRTWATKTWNHRWKRATKSRNFWSKLCNCGLHLVSLALWIWMYNLFRPIIHYRLIIYSSETLKYWQLKGIQKKALEALPLAI